MSWFSRNELADKVTALEQENLSLRADLEAAQAGENQVPALTQEITGLKEDLESAREALTTEESAHAVTRQELTATSAKLEPAALAERITASVNSEDEADAPVKEAVEREVTNRIVAAGHPPLDTLNAEREHEQFAKMSRDSFNNLSHPKRNAFIREGGKITE
jgi:hypothetical protein